MGCHGNFFRRHALLDRPATGNESDESPHSAGRTAARDSVDGDRDGDRDGDGDVQLVSVCVAGSAGLDQSQAERSLSGTVKEDTCLEMKTKLQ